MIRNTHIRAQTMTFRVWYDTVLVSEYIWKTMTTKTKSKRATCL